MARLKVKGNNKLILTKPKDVNDSELKKRSREGSSG